MGQWRAHRVRAGGGVVAASLCGLFAAGPGAAAAPGPAPSVVRITVTAPKAVASGQPLVVRGSYALRPGGLVVLQLKASGRWIDQAEARVSKKATFVFADFEPAGRDVLRVVTRLGTRVLAQSSAFAVTVAKSPVGPVGMTTTALPNAVVGKAYIATLTAFGGKPPYTWQVSGLPKGLSASPGGVISGTPSSPQTTRLRVRVGDETQAGRLAQLLFTIEQGDPRTNTLTAWGDNGFGELGIGTEGRTSPVPVTVPLTGVVAVTGGVNTSYARLADGSLWAWGADSAGQLGDGTTGTGPSHTVDSPTRVRGLTAVTSVVSRGFTGYALDAGGRVHAWGSNDSHAVGDGASEPYRTIPVLVTGVDHVRAIAAGRYTGYALRSDGTVWAWGSNAGGALGNGLLGDSARPVLVAGLTDVIGIGASDTAGFAIRSDGTVWCWGTGSYLFGVDDPGFDSSAVPTQVAGVSHAVAVSAGLDSYDALTSAATVTEWGLHLYSGGPAPLPFTVAGLDHVVTVAPDVDYDGSSTFALREDRTVWGWGIAAFDEFPGAGAVGRYPPIVIPVVGHPIDIGAGSLDGYAISVA